MVNRPAGTGVLTEGMVVDGSSVSTTRPITAAGAKAKADQALVDAKSYADTKVGGTIPAAGVTADVVTPSDTVAPSVTGARTMVGSQGAVVFVDSPKYLAQGDTGYKSITTPSDADSDAVVTAKMASNLKIVKAALADAGGRLVDGGATPIALNGDLTFPTGRLRLNLLHWRGKSSTRPVRPALRVLNLFGAELVGDTMSVQIGPTNPVANITTQYGSTGLQFTAPGGTGQDNQGGYRFVKATDVVEVYCKDAMPGAGETGLTNTATAATWRAELIGVHGIVLNVTSVNLANGGTAVSGYPYQSLERHLIRGAASGVQARANSWAIDTAGGTTGKLVFANVSGDFRNGEALIDDSTGLQIGVAGTMFVAFSGRTLWDYNLAVRMALANAVTPGTWTAQQIIDARPRMRTMNQNRVSLDLTVKTSHDVDTFLTTDERNIPAVEVNGAYCPELKVTALSGYSRLLTVRSCEAPDIQVDATGIANHAIGLANSNAEEAYGYGVELQGVTRFAKVHDSKGRFLRHLFTTNPNSRTWGTTSADGIPDYLGMGCGSMWATVRDSVASECYSAPFDTHEMAWGTRWRNLDVFNSFSGSRVVTAPAGYNTRGWADDYLDCRVDGTVGGFSNGGVALTSGIPYRTIYRQVKATNVQSAALSFSDFKIGLTQDQSGLVASQQAAQIMFATVVIDAPEVDVDNTLSTGQGLQFGIVTGIGQFVWRGGGRIAGFNRAPVRIRAGGFHLIEDPPTADYTRTQSSPFGWQLDGTSYVESWVPLKFIRRTATVPPAAWNDVSGASTILWKGYDYSDSLSLSATATGAARLTAMPVKAGAGTATLTVPATVVA